MISPTYNSTKYLIRVLHNYKLECEYWAMESCLFAHLCSNPDSQHKLLYFHPFWAQSNISLYSNKSCMITSLISCFTRMLKIIPLTFSLLPKLIASVLPRSSFGLCSKCSSSFLIF